MFGAYDKKNLNLIILKILWEHTDANHTLLQHDIVNLVKTEYGMTIDRRSVKNNVDALKDMFEGTSYEISTDNGYCLLEREFDDSEVRMLIDSVLFSKVISQKQAKSLITKLKNLSSKHFNAKVQHIYNLPELQYSDNKQIMYNINALNDAIASKKKVCFTYNEYGTNFKLYPKRSEKYIVNPYQMVANNGRYYLIGNYDKYDDISHYRIDKITNVEILNESTKLIPEIQKGLNLPKHMAEHIYMFSGESSHIKLLANKSIMTELVDWFGKDFRILQETNEQLLISVKSNIEAMKYWALQYGPYVEVIEPISLRDQLKKEIDIMYAKYLERGADK